MAQLCHFGCFFSIHCHSGLQLFCCDDSHSCRPSLDIRINCVRRRGDTEWSTDTDWQRYLNICRTSDCCINTSSHWCCHVERWASCSRWGHTDGIHSLILCRAPQHLWRHNSFKLTQCRGVLHCVGRHTQRFRNHHAKQHTVGGQLCNDTWRNSSGNGPVFLGRWSQHHRCPCSVWHIIF